MTILYSPVKNHGNADTLSCIVTRPCPREDCPDHGHLIKKVKSPSEKKPRLLALIKTRSHVIAGNLDNNCEVVPSLSDKEMPKNRILNSVSLWNYSMNTQNNHHLSY